MARKKKDDGFDSSGVTQEAIPAALKVKHGILTVRDRTIDVFADYVQVIRKKKDARKELETIHAQLYAWYALLREKFPAKSPIREMDEIVTKNREFTIDKLHEFFCMLNKKVEDLKITKIERDVPPKERKMA